MRRDYSPCLLAVVGILSILLLAPVRSSGHDDGRKKKSGGSKAGLRKHLQTDFGFPGFKKLNKQLQEDFYSFSNEENFALREFAETSAAGGNSHLVGTWSPAFNLPLVPIHVMLLTNGNLLMWDSVGDNPAETYPDEDHNFTRASVWDPATNLVTNVDNNDTGYNLFCAGFAHLPDGTPLLAGGNLNAALNGTDTIHLFDQATNHWSLGPTMSAGRWYPSVTPLANGEMLITSGFISTPEVYTAGGTLRSLSSVTWAMPLYPWLHAAPKGEAFYFGPDNTMRFINATGNGSVNGNWGRDGSLRDYGSYAMYDIGKIVASGGGNSLRTTAAINILNPNAAPLVTTPADMAFRRRQHNLTALPDGTVLATGGNSSGASLIDIASNVYAAELWNPQTQTWRTLSNASKVRQYHSSAILLPDGRVFTGGGGICGTCFDVGYLEKNMEIFSPPYLYKTDGSGDLAPRPTIVDAPASVAYDQQFFAETPDSSTTAQAVFMRLSSVTHSIDFEQRRIPLKFSTTVNGLNLHAPPNSNIAPPGYYMLFLIDNAGVPSVAKMVRLEYGSGLGAPLIAASSGGGGNVSLSWIPVLGATSYTIKYGVTPGVYTNSVDVGNVTAFSIGGLISQLYYFAVSASNLTLVGGNSAEVSVVNLNPTAAPVSIAGRVSDPSGRGLRGVAVTLSDNDGRLKRVMTNTFGFYRFASVPAGASYVLSVASKRYQFQNPTLLVTANENISNADFVSN